MTNDQRAAVGRLEKAAHRLACEVRGLLGIAEGDIREAVGHTNVACLQRAECEVSAALDLLRAMPSDDDDQRPVMGISGNVLVVGECGARFNDGAGLSAVCGRPKKHSGNHKDGILYWGDESRGAASDRAFHFSRNEHGEIVTERIADDTLTILEAAQYENQRLREERARIAMAIGLPSEAGDMASCEVVLHYVDGMHRTLSGVSLSRSAATPLPIDASNQTITLAQKWAGACIQHRVLETRRETCGCAPCVTYCAIVRALHDRETSGLRSMPEGEMPRFSKADMHNGFVVDGWIDDSALAPLTENKP